MSVFKQSVIKHFNAHTDSYDAHCSVHKQVATKLTSLVPDTIYNDILEIGCGTGVLSKHLVSRFPNSALYLSDIAANMVKKCGSKILGAQYLVCDGENIPSVKRWDLVVSSLAFQWFEDFNASVGNIKKYCDTLVFSTLLDGSFQEWDLSHDKLGIKNSMLSLKKANELSECLLEIEDVMISFEDGIKFLQHLRALGAIGDSTYNTSDLKRLVTHFKDGISINYRIGYCRI